MIVVLVGTNERVSHESPQVWDCKWGRGCGLQIDFRGRLAEGTLQQLTIPQLKVYLRAAGLPLDGKKADVVQRVTSHLATSA